MSDVNVLPDGRRAYGRAADEETRVDALIRRRMEAALTPGLSLAVVLRVDAIRAVVESTRT